MARTHRPPALDPRSVPEVQRTNYPGELAKPVAGRFARRLTSPLELTRLGLNLVRLSPGAWSSQRHWHEHEDEFLYVLEGSPTLVTNEGRQQLSPGMMAGFPAGKADGHHLVNESDRDALILAGGSTARSETVRYSEADLLYQRDEEGTERYTKGNGQPF